MLPLPIIEFPEREDNMIRFKRHLSPGLVLGVIALVVALGGTSIAVEQAKVAKKSALKGRLGGGTTEVVQTETLLPQTQNNGLSDYTVTCPSAGSAGSRRAIAGGVVDPVKGNNLAPLTQKTDGPMGKAWYFQFDNDTNVAFQVQLHVLCTLDKLNVKR
jgi:hypothetical protein